MRRIGSDPGSIQQSDGGTGSRPPSPPSSPPRPGNGPSPAATAMAAGQQGGEGGSAALPLLGPGVQTLRDALEAVSAADQADPQLGAVQSLLDQLAALANGADLPEECENLAGGLEDLRELIPLVDARRLLAALPDGGQHLAQLVEHLRTDLAAASALSQQGKSTATYQEHLQVLLAELCGTLGLGLAEEERSDDDIRLGFADRLRWAIRVTLPGDDPAEKAIRVERIMDYLGARLADCDIRAIAGNTVDAIGVDTACLRWSQSDDEARFRTARLKGSLQTLLAKLDQAGAISLPTVEGLARMPVETAAQAEAVKQADEESKVRDGTAALAEGLRRALDGPRRPPADAIGVLSEALDGFNMKRLRLKLQRFGIDLGSQFDEVAMALQSAIVAEGGGRADVAARAADRLERACSALCADLDAALQAAWRVETGGVEDHGPLGAGIEDLVGDIGYALQLFKHEPGMNRANLRRLEALLDERLRSADLQAAATTLLDRSGHHLALSVIAFREAMQDFYAAFRVVDEFPVGEQMQVETAFCNLMDDLCNAGLLEPLQAYLFQTAGWPDVPVMELEAAPAVVTTTQGLVELARRTVAADSAAPGADPRLTALATLVAEALEAEPDIELGLLHEAFEGRGIDLLAWVRELQVAVIRAENPMPGDSPDLIAARLVEATRAILSVLRRADIVTAQEIEDALRRPGDPRRIVPGLDVLNFQR